MPAAIFIRTSILITALFCIFCCSAIVRAQRNNIIPASGLQADFAVLKKAYEDLHPGLYRYNSRAQMAANFDALRTELDQDLDLPQAYTAFSKFLAKIKCGHTYPNFYNQPKAVAKALFKDQDKVPFYFRWIDRKMIVTRNFSDEEAAAAILKPGTEVLSIDGVPVAKILQTLLSVARADGSNDAKRVSYLEVQGENNYEAFDVYFPLFFPQTESRFRLTVKEPFASKQKTLTVRALTYEQRIAPVKAQLEARRGGSEQLWEFKFLDEKTAYLRMPTWALYNSKWDWKTFLANAFDQLADERTANLIIDLRGNEGGESIGDVILSRLVKQDLRLDQFKRLVRYRKAPDDLLPFLDTWDQSFKDWGAAAVDLGNGFYTLKKYDDDQNGNLIKAAARPFSGRTFVMVDASNSSATFEFAEAVQENKLAKLVGQPTGGNKRGINGGAFFFLRLPNSKIEIDLPLIGFFPDGEQPDFGLRPDILIKPSIKDVAAGADTELTVLKKML